MKTTGSSPRLDRLKGWHHDRFRALLLAILAVAGCALLYQEYGHLLPPPSTPPAETATGAGGSHTPMAEPETVTMPWLGEARLSDFSLPLLAVTLGLIDGFNPCAMWALVYLISLIAGIADRRKIMLLVGSFVAASGILYFLFMTAWLNVFLVIGYLRPLTIGVGLFALGAGILSLREFVASKGALACRVTDGASRQRTMGRMEGIVRAPLTCASFLAIVALAFTVNTIEFACSAALPAIFTHTLALRQLPRLHYYGYILLYDLFFMLDDLIIFTLAALAVTTTVGMKYARQCKLLGGVVLILLGLAMLFRPDLLR
ncbi:MAG: hypothetical protein OEV91_10000 [Desulfobulbaceae bacterium]|nr:hypothetical protein [Desulfobulbaceae bacterium]